MTTVTEYSILRQTPTLINPTFPHKQTRHRSERQSTLRCSISPTTISPPEGGVVKGVGADCVVVGGGISGLCIAQALATKHEDKVRRVIVTESKDRVGGNISSVERDGYLWEEGPNSFQPSDSMLSLAVNNGLKDELVLGDPNAPRFVLWDGKLRPVPSKPTDLPFFDLMSFGGKIRAGLGAFGLRPPPPPGREESVEEFVRRNLGDEVFERLIEPFCSGVYAGDPSQLSMKAAFGKVLDLEQTGGSIIGGAFKAIQERNKTPKLPRDPRLPKPKGQTVGSFRKGLVMLPNAIAERLGDSVKLSWKLSRIVKLDDGGYTLMYETPEGMVSLQSKSVVFTVPSYVASGLLHNLSATAADALSKFYYPPVAVVSISYPKEAIRSECLIDGELKGFGQLHPRSQGVETLGTIYSSSLFPNRAPAGRTLLLNFIGGATSPGILSKEKEKKKKQSSMSWAACKTPLSQKPSIALKNFLISRGGGDGAGSYSSRVSFSILCSVPSRRMRANCGNGGITKNSHVIWEDDGVIIVDHGSRHRESNLMLDEFVAMFRSKTGYPIVEPAHMELASPSIRDAYGLCVQQGAKRVIVSPFFLFPGRHWHQDIPLLTAEAAKEHPGVPYIITAPLGLHTLLVDVVNDRIKHCLSHIAGDATECAVCVGSGKCKLYNTM